MLRAMTDKIRQNDKSDPATLKLKSEAKQARLSEALRSNLRRRKEQARERKTPASDTNE